QVIFGQAFPDQARQPLGGAQRSPAHFRVADGRPVGRNDEVAARGDLAAAAEVLAVARADHRFFDALQELVRVARQLPSFAQLAFRHAFALLDVGARAENAFTGGTDDDDPYVVVAVQPGAGVAQLPQHDAVEGVSLFDPVQGDRTD